MDLADAPRFLTLEQLQGEVARFSYRPGWELSVFPDVWEGAVLRVVAKVPDAYHPDNLTPLQINSRIPPIPDVVYFGHYLLWRLLLIESHECREWLRRDGVMLFNPHDPIEPRLDVNDPAEPEARQ